MIQYVVRTIKSPRTGEAKYFPAIAPTQPVLRNQIIKEIEKLTSLSSSDIKSCLDALEYQVVKALQQGYAVRLGDLGSFRPTLSAKSVDTLEKCDASLIKGVRCRFTPSSQMNADLDVKAITFQRYAQVADVVG